MGRAYRCRNDAVVDAARLNRIWVEPEQIDVGVGRVVDKVRVRVAAQVLLDDEGFGSGNVGVDPIRLGLQIGGKARAGFISNVEAIQVRIVFECADSSLKISVGSVGETKVNEALDAGRQRIEFPNRADVRQVEAIRSRSIDAIDEISGRR